MVGCASDLSQANKHSLKFKLNYKTLLKIVITAIIFTLVFTQVDFHAFSKNLFNLSFSHILGALICLILQSAIVAKRWGVIVKKLARPVPYMNILMVNFRSLSSSLVLPNIIAEPAVKAYLLKEYDVPVADAITSVIIDKLFVLIGLLSLTILIGPCIFFLYPETQIWLHFYLLIIVILILANIIFRLKLTSRLPGKMIDILEKYKKYIDALKYMLFDKEITLPCLMLSFFSQAMAICAVFILSLVMEPGLTFVQCVLFMPPVMFVTALPIAFNGWGVRELAMVYMLGFANVQSEAALALSVQFGTIGLLLWSIGLIFWIPVMRKGNENT
jgi:glycosyltransferase 2 family protein